MIVGYGILLALAIGFVYVGAKGFSTEGLPLTRSTRVTGRAAKAIGVSCIGVGACILMYAMIDVLITFGPQPTDSFVVPQDLPIAAAPVPPMSVKKSLKSIRSTKLAGEPIPGLLAYWSFDEIQEGVVPDLSGRGNHGIVHGAARVDGVKGNALYIRGKGEYFEYGESSDFNFAKSSEFTIAWWLKTEQKSGTVLSHQNSKTDQASWISVQMLSHSLAVVAGGDIPKSPAVGILSDPTFNDNKWHHIALLRRADMAFMLYIDGRYARNRQPDRFDSAITTDVCTLGVNMRSASQPHLFGPSEFSFLGQIDEFYVFDLALDEMDLARLIRLDGCPQPKNRTNRKE